MPIEIFKYAAGITSGLSLAAFLAALYFSLQSQKRERSIISVVKGEGVLQAETVVKVLKEFTSEENRIVAFFDTGMLTLAPGLRLSLPA